MTPEKCSAEILRKLFGYLPEELRNNPEAGTVITVPAAFNLMQEDATMAAADMAGLGSVALMQEPVAAVMSVMRQRKGDGMFLVYDLGGRFALPLATRSPSSSDLGSACRAGGARRDRCCDSFPRSPRPWR